MTFEDLTWILLIFVEVIFMLMIPGLSEFFTAFFKHKSDELSKKD